MRKYTKTIIGSMMAIIILSTPFATFAESKKDNENHQNVGRMEQQKGQTKEKSWFGSDWFNGRKLKATTSPVISNLIASSIRKQKATVKWETDVRSNSFVWYSTVSPVDTTLAPNMKHNDRTLKHKFELKKLLPNTKYYIVVGSTNNIGMVKSTEISFTTSELNGNNLAPIITNVIGQNTLKIGETENVTINAYDPQSKVLNYFVDWGDGSVSPKYTFNQTVSLGHVYSTVGTFMAKFTIENSDGKDTSSTLKIIVTPVLDTVSPVISDIHTTISGTNVIVTWKTDEPTNSTVFYNTTTPVDTNSISTPKVIDTVLNTTHSINIPSLTPSTLYHFIIKSLDVSNNVTLSSEITFSTN